MNNDFINFLNETNTVYNPGTNTIHFNNTPYSSYIVIPSTYKNIDFLPENLIFHDMNVMIDFPSLQYLPDNLTIPKLIISSNSKLTDLPSGLNVEILNISGSNIKKIPDDIIITRSIFAENIQNLELPNELHILGYLCLSDSTISKIPSVLSVEHLIIKNCNMTIYDLPDYTYIGVVSSDDSGYGYVGFNGYFINGSIIR